MLYTTTGHSHRKPRPVTTTPTGGWPPVSTVASSSVTPASSALASCLTPLKHVFHRLTDTVLLLVFRLAPQTRVCEQRNTEREFLPPRRARGPAASAPRTHPSPGPGRWRRCRTPRPSSTWPRRSTSSGRTSCPRSTWSLKPCCGRARRPARRRHPSLLRVVSRPT